MRFSDTMDTVLKYDKCSLGSRDYQSELGCQRTVGSETKAGRDTRGVRSQGAKRPQVREAAQDRE